MKAAVYQTPRLPTFSKIPPFSNMLLIASLNESAAVTPNEVVMSAAKFLLSWLMSSTPFGFCGFEVSILLLTGSVENYIGTLKIIRPKILKMTRFLPVQPCCDYQRPIGQYTTRDTRVQGLLKSCQDQGFSMASLQRRS